jgi:hypothetical protein
MTVNFHAGGELLSALLNHLDPLIDIIPNIPILKREFVFFHNSTDSATPSTVRFEIGNNLGLVRG